MGRSSYDPVEQGPAWNAGKKLGAKRPLKPKEFWEIRFMLDRELRVRDRALLDLAIDSKLRGRGLVKVRSDLVRNRETGTEAPASGDDADAYSSSRQAGYCCLRA